MGRGRGIPLLLALILSLAGCDGSEEERDADADADADAEADAEDASDADADEPDADREVTRSEIDLPGLNASVTEHVDAYGVIHLLCQTDEDCMRAMGYITASRSFYIIDSNRRWMRGRWATLVGDYGIAFDRENRQYYSTPEGEPLEEAIWERLRPDTQALFEAYAAGVTAWIEDLRRGRNGARLPEEYGVGYIVSDPLGTIEDWEALDSIALWVAGMTQSDYQVPELDSAAVREVLPAGMFEDIWLGTFARPVEGSYAGVSPPPPLPAPRPPERVRVPRALLQQARAHQRLLEESRRRMGVLPGTNNWALGSGFTGGPSIVACDPHSPFQAPSRYLPFVLDSASEGEGTFHVGGAGVLGTPVLYVGFNEELSWGSTTAYVDVTDIYLETLTPSGDGVLFEGREVPFVEREHTIVVADDPPRTETVTLRWVPHHGPVIALDTRGGVAMTRRWAGQGAPADVEAYLDMMRSSSVDEAMDHLARTEATGGNLVLADVDGSVGWHVTVRFPNRPWASPELAPWLPLPGDGTAEWEGLVPMEQHPRELDPDRGYVWSANNAISDQWADGDPTDDGLPCFQSWFKPGWRFNRIRELLETTRGDHSLGDTLAIQSDTRANPAVTILPGLLDAAHAGPRPLNPWATSMVDLLSEWELTCPTGLDGHLPDSPYSADPVETREALGCTAYHAAMVFVGRAALQDEFEEYLEAEEVYYASDIGQGFLHRALSAPESLLTGEAIWDDVGTLDVETREETIRRGLNDAGSHLDVFLGEVDDWRWGRVHTVTFESVVDLDDLAIGPYANDGAENSVDRGDFDFEATGFANTWGPIMRVVVELGSDGPTALVQVPAGLTGDRESPYYSSMTELWLDNEPVPVAFSVDEAAESAVEIVLLQP